MKILKEIRFKSLEQINDFYSKSHVPKLPAFPLLLKSWKRESG
jgi:hypothetical protein